jgi:GDP-4-dehydro-6-deoxy-D-mannose reductase
VPAGPILVTGAGGFAGSHLVEHLALSGPVVGWSRADPPKEIAPLAAWTSIDLLDRDRVRREILALRPAAVFHCAGAPHVGASWQDTATPLASNVLATHYLLDALRRADAPCRVLITGSASVYAASASPLREDDTIAPASPYAVSKLAQEQLGMRGLSEDGLDVIVVRPFNHTGPRQKPSFAAPGMARQIALIESGAAKPVIKVGNLETVRDLTDVRDTVRAYALLMDRGVAGTVYNVASGVGRSIRAVLEALASRARVPVRIDVDPERLRPQDIPVVIGDASRLREATGWAPAIPFERTIDDLLEYWRRSCFVGSAEHRGGTI